MLEHFTGTKTGNNSQETLSNPVFQNIKGSTESLRNVLSNNPFLPSPLL